MTLRTTGTCALCGLPIGHAVVDEDGRTFCCEACREVDRLLAATPATAPPPADGPVTETTFHVAGLRCTSCSWLIGATLRRTPGVRDAEVSYLRREARVAYDPEMVTPQRLQRRIRRLGYRAWGPDDTAHDEEEAVYYRLLVTFVLTMKVMLISAMLYARTWLGWWQGEAADEMAAFFRWILLLGAVPVVLILGLPILRAGVAGLVRARPNTQTLIAIGSFAAVGLSVRNLLVGIDRLYLDTATALLFLMTVGHWLELRARKRSREAVDRLWTSLPRSATVVTADGGEEQIDADAVPVGRRVLVRPGERVPVDGVVAAGSADVDESILTGEPVPVPRGEGDAVRAGTIALDGALEVVASATGTDTLAGRIGRLLEQALWERSPSVRLADRLAAAMVPIAVVLAAATFALWSSRSGVEVGLMNSLAVLLIACPCALGIATPLTQWVTVGRAAEEGVLLRRGDAVELAAAVRRVAFDKTGTLTARPLRFAGAVVATGEDRDRTLRLVAALEHRSEHPLAEAIAAALPSDDLPRVDGYRVRPGLGVEGTVDGEEVRVGNDRLLEGMELSEELGVVRDAWEAEGRTVVLAGWGGRVRAILGLDEELRPGAWETLEVLRERGTDVLVLTGDSARAAGRWESRLQVPVHGGLHPEDKIRLLEASPVQTAMVGDGINDAPALAAATLGIAVGPAADVTRSSADVVLLGDDPRAVPWVLDLARASMRKVRWNLVWAFSYNVAGLSLAVSGLLRPVLAAAAMVLSSVVVTANSMRLRRFPGGAA